MDHQFVLKEVMECEASSVQQAPRKPEKSYSASQIFWPFPKDAHPVSFPKNVSKSLPLSPCYTPQESLCYMDQCFDKIKYLAEGSFGVVYQARSKDDGKFYAIKKFKQRFRSHLHRRARLCEVQRYGCIPSSPFCVELIRAWEEDAFLFVQMELCSVTLRQYARVHRTIEEETLWKILLDVLLAVKHLHVHEYIHLDIKPDNILVSSDHVFKLGDFGLMLDLSKGPVFDAEEGDSRYLAPEVLNGVYTKSADIFSLGMSMLDVASDIQLPCYGSLWQELRSGILPHQHFTCPNNEFYAIIRLMMAPSHSLRPSAEKLLKFCKLQKLQRKRCVEAVFDGMAASVKSLCHFSKAIVINCGLSIFKPFASRVCGIGWKISQKDLVECDKDCLTSTSSTAVPLNHSTPVQCFFPDEGFAVYKTDAEAKFHAKLASCKKRLDLNNGEEFPPTEDTFDAVSPKRRLFE